VKLDFAVLAEAAAVGDRKLFLHGAGLRRFDLPQIPWFAALAIGVRFTAELDEAGDVHSLTLRLLSPSDIEIMRTPRMELAITPADEVPADWEEISVVAALNSSAVAFHEQGWHVVELIVDEGSADEQVIHLRLRIVQMPRVEQDD
jgi:hypothetical protein